MPLINRIEVTNFMNCMREEPWRPDWPYQVFELERENTAINMPNGRGKSTIALGVLGLLASDKSLVEWRNKHCAPATTGMFTHLRIETYVWADDNAPDDMLVRAGGESGGYPMVFGIYGNAGENNSHKVYSYRGTFENCPIGWRNGNQVTLASNQAFLDKLAEMPARFPATQREDTRTAWRSYVSSIFDMPSVEQQLVYQKAKGAEGSSGYFDTKSPRGERRSFSERVFYERLAPELLVDMMGTVEEYADERGIEDVVIEKAQGIIRAKVRTTKTADELAKTKRVLDELRRIGERSDAVATARGNADDKIGEFSLARAVLGALVIDDPVPGIPSAPPDSAPALAPAMILLDGNWYLPDHVFGRFTEDSTSHVNERASTHQIKTTTGVRTQRIEITVDLKIRDERGKPNRLYDRDAARAWLAVTTNFKGGYTRETAIRDVEEAFAWAEANGDTNPARRERSTLHESRQAVSDRLASLKQRAKELETEQFNLLAEQKIVGEQQAEFQKMTDSGLFTAEELSNPAETERTVLKEVADSDRDLRVHVQKVADSRSDFQAWTDFVSVRGADADPANIAAALEDRKTAAERALSENRQALQSAKQAEVLARTGAARTTTAATALASRIEKIHELRPGATAFTQRFGSEDPHGVALQVKDELKTAERRKATIAAERAQMKEALAALQAFVERLGDGTDPKAWLAARDADRIKVAATITKERDDIAGLRAQRADLKEKPVAPGKIARELLSAAGNGASPLYAVIEKMGLPADRKDRILTLFSALLHCPVFPDAAQATAAAKKVAEMGMEAPVLLAPELEEFCRHGEISYDGAAARTWLVGVRTRQVDCLLDPSLVEREKAALDAQIAAHEEVLAAKEQQIEDLSPESDDAIMARKAREAIEKNYPVADADFVKELVDLDEAMPQLLDRASDAALDSIRAVQDLRKVLGSETEEEISDAHERAIEAAELAGAHLLSCEEAASALDVARESLQTEFTQASVSATEIPTLRRIKAFIAAGGPEFRSTAVSTEDKLKKAKARADTRKGFDFQLAGEFVKRGGKRPQEIEERIRVVTLELRDVRVDFIPADEQALAQANEQLRDLDTAVVQIDAVVRDLQKKYRDMARAEVPAVPVPPDAISSHPLFTAAEEVRRAQNASAAAAALRNLETPLSEIETATLSGDVQAAMNILTAAQSALSAEIDRVNGDGNLALNEHMRITLELAKNNSNELSILLSGTEENYNKTLAANNTAKKYLDDAWDDIAKWLENFTRRLPGNFEVMQTIFNPARDPVSKEIVAAGFEISGKVSDMKDVRAVLTDVVAKVETAERTRETFGDDEAARTATDRNLRKEIRDAFYRKVVTSPDIRVCIPSISRKPLKLEENMVSSGQGVAMTLLWIIKMADYITEREIRRQTTSSAGRKRLRSKRTQFVVIDGAFSHLSDKKLITDALDGIKRTRGKLQLIITGHDPNYRNDYTYFPSYIIGRPIGGNLMYADCLTRRILTPEDVGSRSGVMEVATWHKRPETVA